MNFKTKGVTCTAVFLFALIGLFSGIYVSNHLSFNKKMDMTQFHGTYLENPRSVTPFRLTGTDEKVFDNASLQGRWTMMFFGFTHCGYLCPTTMAELGKMYRILEDKKTSSLPQVVMVSIDPERDDLEKLGRYVAAFHPDFYGARTDDAMIKVMTREMGVAYLKVKEKNDPDSKNYDVQHSGTVMLFNPKGELNAFFTTPHNADLLAKDYLLLAS